MKSFFIFFSVVAAIGVVTGTDYCQMKCRDYRTGKIIEHIGCRASYKFNSKSCPPNAKLIDMTPALRSILVDSHNEKRNMIAGGLVKKYSPACRMATIQWDDELAKLAALNVQQCTVAHDRCHNTGAFPISGQNIATQWAYPAGNLNYEAEIRNGVEKWFEEARHCNQDIMDSYPRNYRGRAIGHFTVMMADRNIRLGCAASTYDKNDRSNLLFVCNYATTNMIGSPIYKSCSRPAEDCTTGTNPLYKNLCSVNEIYE